jgi:arylsulfatase A-like enzyme
MEVFAGFAEHTDHEIGRLISAIEEMGELENTIIFFIAGDNGSSAEGQQTGMFNEWTYFNREKETVEDMMKLYEEWGTESTNPHMAAGWAVATNSPFSWDKTNGLRFWRNPKRIGGALA